MLPTTIILWHVYVNIVNSNYDIDVYPFINPFSIGIRLLKLRLRLSFPMFWVFVILHHHSYIVSTFTIRVHGECIQDFERAQKHKPFILLSIQEYRSISWCFEIHWINNWFPIHQFHSRKIWRYSWNETYVVNSV